ncbi:MAG: hypothetical protein M3Q56_07840 [Bacteroidota bacterium]|nr:hypothetical protein [Bacteroidota bacterium]
MELRNYIKFPLIGILIISSALITYIMFRWNPYVLINNNPKYYIIPYDWRQIILHVVPIINSLLLILSAFFIIINYQKPKHLLISLIFNASSVLIIFLLSAHYPVCVKKYANNGYLFWEQGWQQDCKQFKRWKSNLPSNISIDYDHATWHLDSISVNFN